MNSSAKPGPPAAATSPSVTTPEPLSTISAQEARDAQPTLHPGLPKLPTRTGLPTSNIPLAPSGRESIFGTYAAWKVTLELTPVRETDHALHRPSAEQRPARVIIGSLSVRYALLRNNAVGSRFEYFNGPGGVFSGTTQALKEFTFADDHTFRNDSLA